MDWGEVIAGIVAIGIGVLLVLKRHGVAAFMADAARQSSGSSSLLNRERTERNLVGPYNSPDGRRTSAGLALALGVLLCAGGIYVVVLELAVGGS